MTRLMKPYTFLLLAAIAIMGCERDYDKPPIPEIPEGNVITLGQLRAMYGSEPLKIEGDTSVYAVVTADERSGNIYREVYVQDQTAALQLRLLNPGGLYIGDSVRIYLPGTVLSSYQGMLQLDSVDAEYNIVKQATNVEIDPMEVTLEEVSPGIQGRLVTIDSVQFASSAVGNTYADAVNLEYGNRTLTDCDGNEVIVRTSGYADFASDTIPSGNGSITAIVSQFQSTMQLLIRNLDDVNLDGERCGDDNGGGTSIGTGTVCDPHDIIEESFDGATAEEAFAGDCWYNVATAGNRLWLGKTFQSNIYLQATAYNSTDANNEMWLISPPVQATGTNILSFESAKSFYEHDGLKVFISTNYDGSAEVTESTWQPINADLAGLNSSDNEWVESGDVQISGYLPQGYSGTFFIGFRYQGNDNAGETTSYRVDNISISE